MGLHRGLLGCDICLTGTTRAWTMSALQVYDAGRTEVAAGSNTVLAVGGLADAVDTVTGQLSTLR